MMESTNCGFNVRYHREHVGSSVPAAGSGSALRNPRTLLTAFLIGWNVNLAHSPVAHADQWTSEAFRLTEEDFQLLPPLCRAKTAQSKNQEVQAIWMRQYGAAWEHMHHYCFGKKALALAYRYYSDSKKRAYFSSQSANEFDYVLGSTESNFPLRTEILIQRGRAKVLAREYDDAKKTFEEVLKRDPKSIDGWSALSDMYSQMGRNADAIAVLEEAIEVTGGEHKKLKARLDDLRLGRKR